MPELLISLRFINLNNYGQEYLWIIFLRDTYLKKNFPWLLKVFIFKILLKKNFSINLLIWIIFLIILLRNTQLEQFCSGDKRKCIEVEGKPISCWLAGDENDRLKFRIEIKKKETLLCRTMVLPGCLFFTSSLIHKWEISNTMHDRSNRDLKHGSNGLGQLVPLAILFLLSALAAYGYLFIFIILFIFINIFYKPWLPMP